MSQFGFQDQSEKVKLRKNALLQRQSLSIDVIGQQMREYLQIWKQWKNFSRVLAYSPFRGEADLLPLARHSTSIPWFLPITQEDGIMIFARYLPSEEMTKGLKLGNYGILEPELSNDIIEIPQPGDLILVPGLLFDSFGNRLGYGKGYYDRFLNSQSNSHVCLIGVSPLPLHEPQLPSQSWDIQVDYLLTKNGIFEKK
jgi:5-formyltetrahydrofolate cyclo-ligase